MGDVTGDRRGHNVGSCVDDLAIESSIFRALHCTSRICSH